MHAAAALSCIWMGAEVKFVLRCRGWQLGAPERGRVLCAGGAMTLVAAAWVVADHCRVQVV